MRVNIEFSNKYTTWTNRDESTCATDDECICAGNSVHLKCSCLRVQILTSFLQSHCDGIVSCYQGILCYDNKGIVERLLAYVKFA